MSDEVDTRLENERVGTYMGIPIVRTNRVEQLIVDEGQLIDVERMEAFMGNMRTLYSDTINIMGTSSTPIGFRNAFYEELFNDFIDSEESLCNFFQMVDSNLSKKDRDKRIDKIVKEIYKNKDFKACFKNIKEEVKSWNDIKLNNWK